MSKMLQSRIKEAQMSTGTLQQAAFEQVILPLSGAHHASPSQRVAPALCVSFVLLFQHNYMLGVTALAPIMVVGAANRSLMFRTICSCPPALLPT